MHAWSCQCLPQNLDALTAALSGLDTTRLVITRTPGKKRETVQYFSETKREAVQLQKMHGGTVVEITAAQASVPAHPPIRIRDRFVLLETAGTSGDDREIIIPSGLAFGTGDHPTTASCLRLLCDASAAFSTEKWSLLDVGTGSGVIAIAARKLGANSVSAFDYDPLSIRTARENARLNRVRGIGWQQLDLQTFAASKTFDIVTANIFSELFLYSWKRIQKAVAPGGNFILSGILRFQADECRSAMEQAGFAVLREVRLGKWVTFLARASLK